MSGEGYVKKMGGERVGMEVEVMEKGRGKMRVRRRMRG